MQQPLNEKQQKVYEFLRMKSQSGLPPTVREICAATKVKSTSTVHGILSALEEYGYISRNSQNARAIFIAQNKKPINIPLLGRVTAGLPILAVEQIEDYIPFYIENAGSKEFFALRVVGESMINAGIFDDDIVVCEKVSTANDGDIVVALIEDEATVKRLYREKFGVRLQPENDKFDAIYAAKVLILGKVIASLRFYK